MNILIDWGNSDLKLVKLTSLDNAALNDAQVITLADLDGLMLALADEPITQVLVASVRSDRDNQALIDCFNDKPVFFARTQSRACGVQCGYQKPDDMGVDRWLGIIAASSELPVAVISIGSAITLDLVKSGQHLGGQIAPGFRLQMQSLKQTGRVRPQSAFMQQPEFSFGGSTTECVNLGIYSMIEGYLQHLIENSMTSYPELQIVFCGGGGAAWFARLKTQFTNSQYRSKLVFEGLVKLYLDKPA